MTSPLQPSPTAIVVGASSGIGEAIARRLAREGYRVALLARRADRLQSICDSINKERNANVARAYPHDVCQYDKVPALFQTILREMGRLDALVYATGVMPGVGLAEYNFEKDKAMMEANVLGALAWLSQAADMFDRTGAGHIVGISSVAGDRGRVINPGYNASKAALSTYLEALRNRLSKKGASVLTVKPGFVKTQMLAGIQRTPFAIEPDQLAADVWHAMRHRKQTIYSPARWALIMLVIRHIPSFIFRRLSF